MRHDSHTTTRLAELRSKVLFFLLLILMTQWSHARYAHADCLTVLLFFYNEIAGPERPERSLDAMHPFFE